jgi:tRNA-2-methylthio-N6-dimethylallyladenosine synthase
MTENSKKLYIKTWGCQMNVYDSRRMVDVLAPLGYKEVQEPEGADMVILNTCHIREKATDKVFSELGRLKLLRDKKAAAGDGKMLMAVAGCVAQAEGDFIHERAPYIDMIFGPQTYHNLPEMVAEATGQLHGKRVVHTEFPVESKFDSLPEESQPQGATAFLSIQEGCDKFCTFCVVPYTRGAEYSRTVEDIIEEAKRIADQGSVEISLLGQNVNAYHGQYRDGRACDLADLIAHVAEIEGIKRIRYTTSHPRDMDDRLIAAHGSIEKLMPFLHLPVQSGSDTILKTMNRKHTSDRYREIVANLRKVRPDIEFSSDFIVGFPGETDQDFNDTMQLIQDVHFASAFSFKYSPRPGTPAANMLTNLVREEVKSERLSLLQALVTEQHIRTNQKSVGKIMPVLLDWKGREDNQLHGRTPYNQPVYIKGNERLIGHIVDVEITHGAYNALQGDIVLT